LKEWVLSIKIFPFLRALAHRLPVLEDEDKRLYHKNMKIISHNYLAWLILDLTDSPFLVALVGFFSSVPMFLLGLVGGMLADRVHRQRLLSLTQGTNVISSFMLTLLLSTRVVPF